jgi:diguanylate cyclase (GGDEF)-like protein
LKQQDLVAKYRRLITVWFGFGITPLVFPFSMYHAFWGEPSIGVLAFVIGGSLIANAFEAKQNARMVVPPEVLFILIMLATVIGFQTLGLTMAFWCYPVPLFFLFAVEWRKANLLALGWLVFVAISSFYYLPPNKVLRIVVTLAITTIIGWLFVALIRQLQDELSKLASHDSMTGVLNRGQVIPALNLARERVVRGQEVSSVVMVDIDHFKSINDTFGHQAGDKVILQVVETLKNRLRKLDQIFRYGGEEFLILLSAASAVEGRQVCEELRSLMEHEITIRDRVVTASFGLAEISPTETSERWIARADEALYKAKETGRNRVCVAPSAPSLAPHPGQA